MAAALKFKSAKDVAKLPLMGKDAFGNAFHGSREDCWVLVEEPLALTPGSRVHVTRPDGSLATFNLDVASLEHRRGKVMRVTLSPPMFLP
jgi:hypothetical protein